MKPNIAEIKELNDFCETWFSVAKEWDPLSQDEIDTVKDLIASNKSLIGEVERQAEEIKTLRHELEIRQKGGPLAKQLSEEIERLRKTIAWYADSTNYILERVVVDSGQRAREALQQ